MSTCTIIDQTSVFLMADKFGAAMALVKSDIGGNISVCFVTCYYLVFFFLVCVILWLLAVLNQWNIFFHKVTCHGLDSFFKFKVLLLVYTFIKSL
jgi:hypothetical protein